jgi:hypothetical protein
MGETARQTRTMSITGADSVTGRITPQTDYWRGGVEIALNTPPVPTNMPGTPVLPPAIMTKLLGHRVQISAAAILTTRPTEHRRRVPVTPGQFAGHEITWTPSPNVPAKAIRMAQD